MLNKTIANDLFDILDEENIKDSDNIILSIGSDVRKDDVNQIVDYFASNFKNGTVSIVGDCDFNTSKSDLNDLLNVDESLRKIAFLDLGIKLFALKDDAVMYTHPSMQIVIKGKYANFLNRHKTFDFPFGELSLFKDLYELKTKYITIGNDYLVYPLKYSASLGNPVITRNESIYDETTFEYLDFIYDLDKAKKEFEELSKIYDKKYPIRIINYKEVINAMK